MFPPRPATAFRLNHDRPPACTAVPPRQAIPARWAHDEDARTKTGSRCLRACTARSHKVRGSLPGPLGNSHDLIRTARPRCSRGPRPKPEPAHHVADPGPNRRQPAICGPPADKARSGPGKAARRATRPAPQNPRPRQPVAGPAQRRPRQQARPGIGRRPRHRGSRERENASPSPRPLKGCAAPVPAARPVPARCRQGPAPPRSPPRGRPRSTPPAAGTRTPAPSAPPR